MRRYGMNRGGGRCRDGCTQKTTEEIAFRDHGLVQSLTGQPLVSSRASYVDKALLLKGPVNQQIGAPATSSTGRERDV